MSARRAQSGARVEAQAKLNLFLRVHGREDSGYHQIETLFQRIALADSVQLRVGTAGRSLESHGADTGPVEENLAWRAALAFTDAANWPAGFAIEIEKRIPVGAGLGGGSADAAAVLRALHALAPYPLDALTMSGLALALGADVPFLASGSALSFATGRGEVLAPLPSLPTRRVVLLVPPFGVSSRDAFAWYDAMHGADAPTATPLHRLTSVDWPRVAKASRNDLEEPVFAKHPLLAVLRESLTVSGASMARMTGSGAVVFGIFEDASSGSSSSALKQVPVRVVETETVGHVAPIELW